MNRLTRRRLLATGAAGLAGALSGCSDGSEAGSVPPSGNNDGSTPTPTPTPTPNATTTAAGPDLRYPDFAERTARIADGIEWHATRWEPTMRQVRVLSNRVAGLAGELLEASRVTENDIDELERRTAAVAEFMSANVTDYYDVQEVVLSGNNVYVQQLKIAAQRGDTDNRRQQLRRIQNLYGNYAQPSVLESNFPNGPIHAKLYDDIRASEESPVCGVFHPASGFVAAANADEKPDDDTEDGVPQHVHEFPSGHVVVAHAHPHEESHNLGEHENEPVNRRLYAYREGQFDVLQDTNRDERRFDAFEPELTDVFGPVSLPDRRESVVYATVNQRTADFVALPFQIQRFDSPETAADAVEFLFSADVFDEGSEELGGRTWRRVFYTHQETNVYAFLLQTGSDVLTLFPETVPWGDRVDWPGPFERTWIVD